LKIDLPGPASSENLSNLQLHGNPEFQHCSDGNPELQLSSDGNPELQLSSDGISGRMKRIDRTTAWRELPSQ